MFKRLVEIKATLGQVKKVLDIAEYLSEHDVKAMIDDYMREKTKNYTMPKDKVQAYNENVNKILSELENFTKFYANNEQAIRMLRALIGERNKSIEYTFESIVNELSGIDCQNIIGISLK